MINMPVRCEITGADHPSHNNCVNPRLLLLAASFAGLGLALPADARIKRSQSTKVGYKRQPRCPATGASNGPCQRYVLDYIKPLACGGVDRPENMQWQTVADAKDRWERRAFGK